MIGKHIPLEGYEAELERDHALPTSMPNADILKTNNNPTYHKPRYLLYVLLSKIVKSQFSLVNPVAIMTC